MNVSSVKQCKHIHQQLGGRQRTEKEGGRKQEFEDQRGWVGEDGGRGAGGGGVGGMGEGERGGASRGREGA